MIALSDTAAYSIFGADAVAAVAHCQAPACRAIVFRGPGRGALTVQLDSAGKSSPKEWMIQADETEPPGGQTVQGSWIAFLSQWDTSSSPPLLLVDGVRRTFADARATVSEQSVSGFRRITAAEAMKLSSDPAAANGAVVITTKGHTPPPLPEMRGARPTPVTRRPAAANDTVPYSILTLGTEPGRPGWMLTQSDWDTLTHKPLILVDGNPRTFKDMLKIGSPDSITSQRKLLPAEAMKLSHDSRRDERRDRGYHKGSRAAARPLTSAHY